MRGLLSIGLSRVRVAAAVTHEAGVRLSDEEALGSYVTVSVSALLEDARASRNKLEDDEVR